jgi:hypothetical protein
MWTIIVVAPGPGYCHQESNPEDGDRQSPAPIQTAARVIRDFELRRTAAFNGNPAISGVSFAGAVNPRRWGCVSPGSGHSSRWYAGVRQCCASDPSQLEFTRVAESAAVDGDDRGNRPFKDIANSGKPQIDRMTLAAVR